MHTNSPCRAVGTLPTYRPRKPTNNADPKLIAIGPGATKAASPVPDPLPAPVPESLPAPGPLVMPGPLPESVKAAHRRKLALATAKQAGAQTQPDRSVTLSTTIQKSPPMDKSQPIFSGEAHPVATLFPMMSDEELDELAADIKANGLLNPIVLDENGILIDGRNRQEACRRAQVEPTYAALNGVDPVAFIMSANVSRRHLNKGQQAMAVAFAYPDPDKPGRGKKGKAEETSGFSQKRLQQARQVLHHSRELALAVLGDTIKLDSALAKISEEQKAMKSTEGKLALLREEAPDLAELVAEERLSLDEAHASFQNRKHEAEERESSQRETLCRLGESAYRSTVAWSVAEFSRGLDDRLKDEAFRAMFLQRMRLERSEIPNIVKGAQVLTEILKAL
jgi:hypothetical protein